VTTGLPGCWPTVTCEPKDVAEAVAAFGAALREAGVPAGADRCGRFAQAVELIRPAGRPELLRCAVVTLAGSREQAETVTRVFWATFGQGEQDCGQLGREVGRGQQRDSGAELLAELARAAREHGGRLDGLGDGNGAGEPRRFGVASAVERLAGRDFADLTEQELLSLAGVMRGFSVGVPLRVTRRVRVGRRGREVDLRGTLRQARLSGWEPLNISKKNKTRQPRKLVVLCDISGSMEPYSRAMLLLLYCAAGGVRAEVFSFATRLTRLSRVLREAAPEVALRRAGQVAPDWSGGTRIGESLREFNDSFGCRGVARGAVVVVVSDGWDTGDPAVLRREMGRLSRVAFRIVWVNPRAHRPGYRPLAAGMAAAWPYCDAVVSAHRLDAVGELTAALADPVRWRERTASPP
jgi:uncharacterized protein